MLIGTLRQSDASLIGDRQAPVAAVMLFDASPRMQYRRENRTRLEQAQDMAEAVVRELPPDSQVAVLDSRAIAPVFSLDLSAARKAIERVQITGAPRPFDQLLDNGPAVAGAKQPQTQGDLRLYRPDGRGVGIERRGAAADSSSEQAKDVGLYLIDVGVEEPQNVAIGALQLSAEMMPENSQLTIRTTVSCQRPRRKAGRGTAGGGSGPDAAHAAASGKLVLAHGARPEPTRSGTGGQRLGDGRVLRRRPRPRARGTPICDWSTRTRCRSMTNGI